MSGSATAVLRQIADKLAWTITARALTGKAIVYNPYLAGKFFPAQRDQGYVVVDKPTAGADLAALPPTELWEGYGSTSEEYLASGRDDVRVMLGLLEGVGVDARTLLRVLDLGCAAGRMLRYFPRVDDRSELWGVDLKSEHITWCQQYLSPPLRFATSSTT